MPTEEQRRAYAAALPVAEAAWTEAELYDARTLPPPVVSAVASALGMDPDALWDHVEGVHGWEPHDEGYEDAVWAAAAGCELADDCAARDSSTEGEQR